MVGHSSKEKEVYYVVCACKQVKLEVDGSTVLQSFCHCESCAKYHQTTPVPFAMFPALSVKILGGSEHVKRFSLSYPAMGRFFCKECGYKIYNQRDKTPFRGMPAINLHGFVHQPAMHIMCKDASEQVMQRFKDDGLPKYKDFPKEYGGTGEELEL